MIRHKTAEYCNRINYKASAYFYIVYKQLEQNLIDFDKLNKKSLRDVENFINKLFYDYHVIIVFSVMTLESFINNYLAVCLDDDFFYNNLDKLNLKQKIEVIFNIIWEKKFDKSQKFYNSFHNLIKERNNFVHSKSEKLNTQWFEKHKIELTSFQNSEKDTFVDDYLSQALNEIELFFSKSFEAIRTIHSFYETVDKHDDKCYAVATLMGSMSKNEIHNIQTLPTEIKKELNKIEKKIKEMSKKPPKGKARASCSEKKKN